MADDIERVIRRLDYLAETSARIEGNVTRVDENVTRIEVQVRNINGQVRGHGEEIATLKATCLRVDAIKLSAVIGGVALLIGVLLKIAGIY